jgi:hypothetical protein
VALDAAGAAAAAPHIRPQAMAGGMFDFMGWDRALSSRAAAPEYPCVIDERHLTGERYGIVNVPTALWIDEAGHIVRPPEAPGVSDAFRAFDRKTGAFPREVGRDSRLRRKVYVEAVRDWIENGAASRHVLAPDEVRRRMRGVGPEESLAEAHFRLGVALMRRGARDAATAALERAVALRPESWRFRRQKIVLVEPGLAGQIASNGEFWREVEALGDRFYYPPTEMEGMPPPLGAREPHSQGR